MEKQRKNKNERKNKLKAKKKDFPQNRNYMKGISKDWTSKKKKEAYLTRCKQTLGIL